MSKIPENITRLHSRINQVLERRGANFEEISLVAVTKNVEVGAIREAIAAGIKDVGENRVQEAKRKFPELGGVVKKHLVGHLQRNKVQEALKIFNLIQSVDSPRLIEKISEEAKKQNRTVDVLIQVNMAQEKTKFGLKEKEVRPFLKKYGSEPHFNILGLMMIAPFTEDQELARIHFRKMKKLYNKIKEERIPGVEMRYLSMGMTQDFEVALAEGANMIRIGRAIFDSKSL